MSRRYVESPRTLFADVETSTRPETPEESRARTRAAVSRWWLVPVAIVAAALVGISLFAVLNQPTTPAAVPPPVVTQLAPALRLSHEQVVDVPEGGYGRILTGCISPGVRAAVTSGSSLALVPDPACDTGVVQRPGTRP